MGRTPLVTLLMFLVVLILSGVESTIQRRAQVGDSAAFVRDALKHSHVVIFSKTYCPYCTMAKDVFHKLKQPFTAIELDTRNDGDDIQKALHLRTGVNTVPQVFVGGNFLGGGTDVKLLLDTGKLGAIVNKAVQPTH